MLYSSSSLVFTAAEASLEASYKKEQTTIFDNVGPDYYGDLDEQDTALLKSEREAEEEGTF